MPSHREAHLWTRDGRYGDTSPLVRWGLLAGDINEPMENESK